MGFQKHLQNQSLTRLKPKKKKNYEISKSISMIYFRFSAKHNSDDEWVLVIKYIQVCAYKQELHPLSTIEERAFIFLQTFSLVRRANTETKAINVKV